MQAPTVVLNITIPLGSIQWPQAESITPSDVSGPLTDWQRRNLFVLFNKVFASRSDRARHLFTNMVLGNDLDTVVSWSAYKAGTITYRQASKVRDALAALSDAL